MHPEAFAARKGLLGIGHRHGDHFNQTTVHEGYELNLKSDMPDMDTFDLKIELVNLEERKHSVMNHSPLNFCFPSGYSPITGPYTLQSTDLTEQMAGNKRSIKDDDAYVPETKRRMTPIGRGGKKDSITPLSKSVAKDSHVAQNPVIIDLSGDEEYPVSNVLRPPKATMKSLPPNSTGDFPCYNRAAVYIIIDHKNLLYQYRLHKAVLSRVSPVLAKVLQLSSPKEAMEKLKVASTDAEARFELIYAHKLKKWMLLRTSFTVWKQPMACVKMAAGETETSLATLPSVLSDVTPTRALKETFQIESGEREVITTTSGILTSGIVVDQIKIINVTKCGQNDFQEDGLDNVPAVSHGTESLEHHIEPDSVEHEEKFARCDKFISTKPDNGQASVDHLVINLDAAVEKEEVNSSPANVDPEQLADNPANNGNGQISEKEQEEPIVLVSSSINTQALATPIGPKSPNHKTEIPQPSFASIDLQGPTPESPKLEIELILKPAEDKRIAIKSTSIVDTTQISAETSVHPVNGQQDGIACPEAITVSGPPIELCEAYNNLFLIFYSKSPNISSTSISTALEQCEALVSIATRLECLPVIRPYLAYALCQFGKESYMSVAAEPFRWLNMSMILRSAVMFRESMIHIVATYIPGPEGQINLPEDITVRDLIIFKIRQLDQQRMDVNERLFSSSIMVDSEIVTFSFVGTSTFSTWLVVQIWRDWFCREMARVHLDPHKTGQLYRTLAKSGEAYLEFSEVKATIEKIRHPVKVDPDELKEDLDLLKTFAQKAVKELCENNSMLDVQEAGIGYLTCTKITDEELPWFESEQQLPIPIRLVELADKRRGQAKPASNNQHHFPSLPFTCP